MRTMKSIILLSATIIVLSCTKAFIAYGGVVTATGGTITEVGAYRIHTFTNLGTTNFNVSDGSLDCEILIVAGGGSGGLNGGGGGGAGGVIITNMIVSGSKTVTVGAGGPRWTWIVPGPITGSNGLNSAFDTVIAYGGGRGGVRAWLNPNDLPTSGGSGGGGGASPFLTGANGINGQGQAGGNGYNGGGVNGSGGGGGGAGSAGSNGNGTVGGNGGDGITSDISGSNVTYGGGGGGGGVTAGSGGSGGGGNGGIQYGDDAVPNTGGGGGGPSMTLSDPRGGGAGGSGIVIVRYLIQSSSIAAPENVKASDGTYTNKVSVSWDLVGEAVHYEIWRNTSNNIASASMLAQATNSALYDDHAVSEGLTYYYWVKAKNAQVTSDFSDPDSGYISYAPPEPAGNADLSLMTLLFLHATLTTNQHPGAVSVQLINYGPMNLSSPNTRVAIDLYLSANTTFGDGDDISLGDYTSDQTIGASAYTTVVVPASGRAGLTVPSAVSGGTYNVFARARHVYPSTLVDPDASNNHVMREGAITVVTNGPGADTDSGYHLINDYDGDGKSDLAVYQESGGKWDVMLSGSGYQSASLIFGGNGYDPVLADYDGDGKSDPAIYQESTGLWSVMLSEHGYAVENIEFGGPGFAPVPADYDGDGMADPILYRESTGKWIIMLSGSGYAGATVELGGNGYKAVPADYDGDRRSDLAVYRRSTGDWYLKLSTLDYFTMNLRFGGAGRMPVPADFDGDGKADPAVYNETSGEWNVMMSKYSYMVAQAFHGGNGYVAVPADYDGDGKGDVVVYRENGGILKILLSGSGYAQTVVSGFGGAGYEPVGVAK